MPIYKISTKEVSCGAVSPGSEWSISTLRADFVRFTSNFVRISPNLLIGPYIMPQIIPGITYHQIKRMFDWQMTDNAHQEALADIVNGIAGIKATRAWGEGKTAAGDGQRFEYHRKTLHRTFSHKFNDFAIEFYTFVADNYVRCEA